MISAYHDKATRSRALGIHQTSVYVGTIAGGFFAGYLGQHYGWRWSFIVFGGLGIVLGLVVNQLVIEPARNSELEKAAFEPDAPARALAGAPGSNAVAAGEPVQAAERMPMSEFIRTLRSNPTVLFLMAAFLCANYVAMVLLFWMPDFLLEKFGLSLSMAGLTATICPQLSSMVGAPLGGWVADLWRKRIPAGRMLVQAIGVLGGAPFVLLCGQTGSVAWLIVALSAWGLFKGLYDASIFASVFDVIRPEARGTAAGFMNMVGWLGGGSGPVVIGFLAERYSFSLAISSAALVYLAAAGFLCAAGLAFARHDRMASGGR